MRRPGPPDVSRIPQVQVRTKMRPARVRSAGQPPPLTVPKQSGIHNHAVRNQGRYFGPAIGMEFHAAFGDERMRKAEHDRLFARLLDDKQWTSLEQPAATRPAKSASAPAAKAASPRKRV